MNLAAALIAVRPANSRTLVAAIVAEAVFSGVRCIRLPVRSVAKKHKSPSAPVVTGPSIAVSALAATTATR